MATDPVCKKEVDEKNPPGGKVQFWGQRFYFCSVDCRNTFRHEPQKYAPGKGPHYAKLPDDWRA